ncbi:TraB/GumN family protein [Salinimonas chungwhensis]|uniref:TraB/GumN family protein n=1 Tax=Salinimonas chungwhensis TaxID=265425 RepID=UPI000381729E|nr:TraB/GumN family protein [Salinimonas chungwhensis]
MKRLLSGLALAVAALGVSVCEAASVWQISDGQNTLYLGGTLHILSPDDYPLPEAYNTAFEQADILVFETDMATVASPAFAAKVMQKNTYTEDKTIADVLSANTFAMLKDFLAERHLPVEQVIKFKPAMLGVTLTMMEYQRAGLTSKGVDAHFFAKGTQQDKPVDWFESPDEQLAFLSQMADGQEDAFIRYTLEDIKELKSVVGPMKKHWRNGDMEALYDITIEDFKRSYPDVFEDLLVDRNANWLPKIKQLMKTPETEFILVGTLHMPGEKGVLTLLADQGYTINQLN